MPCAYINSMRKFTKSQKLYMPIKFKIGIFFCFTLLILVFVFVYLNKVVNPVIIESSSAKTRSLSQKAVEEAIRPGISTLELDKIAYDVITSHGATPSFLNYDGFPGSICASVKKYLSSTSVSSLSFLNGYIKL